MYRKPAIEFGLAVFEFRSKIVYISFMPNAIDEKTFKEKIGSRLKELRQKLDLPQKELA